MAISFGLGSSALLPAGLGFRNKIINGDFNIWQRGTSLTLSSGAQTFLADRWSTEYDGSGATRVLSQQAFTLGSPPANGYETAYFHRFNQSVAGTSGTYNLLQQRIEDVRTMAGQTVTVTFFAKAASAFTMPSLTWQQNFGTGGSPSAGPSTNLATNIAITTSWTKYTYTVKVPSISGYTIGTTTPGFLGLRFFLPLNSTFTFDLWGVQVEQNYQPTPFEQRPIGVELALCQRYYKKETGLNVYMPASGYTQQRLATVHHGVPLRAAPTTYSFTCNTAMSAYLTVTTGVLSAFNTVASVSAEVPYSAYEVSAEL